MDQRAIVKQAENLAASGRNQQAQVVLKQALSQAPADQGLHAALGQVLLMGDEVALAMRHFAHAGLLEKVLTDSRTKLANEARPGQWRRFGNLLLSLGRRREAAEAFRQGLGQTPGDPLGLVGLAAALGEESDPELIETMARLADDPATPDQDRASLLFTLGRLADQAGEQARAWEHYSRANRLAGARAVFDRAGQKELVEEICRAFTAGYIREHRLDAPASRQAILIVGMPRSGTSLVEEILASHSQVFGGGELPYLNDMRRVLSERLRLPFPQCMARLTPELAGLLSASYLGETKVAGAGAPRVTDKLPINYMSLGLAAILLPRAKIIYVSRHPADVCLSNFFQSFEAENQPASFSLPDMAFAFGLHARLMRHWRAVSPTPFLEVRYKALVAEPAAQAKRMLAYCGLPWEEQVLSFHRMERMVTTASQTQVRRDIYQSSAGRWRRYQPYLDGLLNELKEQGVRL